MTLSRFGATPVAFFMLLGGCSVHGQGLADATSFIFESLGKALTQVLAEYPANVRAASDIGCDVEQMCENGDFTMRDACSLDGSIFRPEIEAPYVKCVLGCVDGFDCVERAAAEAQQTVQEAIVERCEQATDACDVVTDACRALPAVNAATLEALDRCHAEPCEALQDCYRQVLLQGAGTDAIKLEN